MGLFGKSKKQKLTPTLPDLPEEPADQLNIVSNKNIPDVPAGLPKIETHELPSLPGEEKTKNQQAIKTAVSHIPEMQKSKFNLEKPIQAEPIQPLKGYLEKPRAIEMESSEEPKFIKPSEIKTPFKPSAKKIEPIYIRLDKFETTVETFEEIKNKILEIEELLKKTKEIKQKEEQELIEWEREIQMIKTRIDFIDKNIFNKLD